LVACAALAVAGAWAIEDPDPGVFVCPLEDMCLEILEQCDAADPGDGSFSFMGTVTNCGTATFDEVVVKDAISLEMIGFWNALAPGDSFDLSGALDGNACPDPTIHEIVAKGKIFSGDNDAEPCRIKVFKNTDCDCPPTLQDVCRTPGFWGLRAGEEKDDSQNITQAVIDAAPAGIMVCGEMVDNTGLDMPGSAQEAMCLHPRGEPIHQLARHLTAMALNCVVSGSLLDCDGTSVAALFSDCNAECLAGTDAGEINFCNEAVDCWNNGGTLLDNGMCQMGVCFDTGAACEEDEDCGFDDLGEPVVCVPFEDTCHDRPLVNEDLGLFFDPPGPAGSSKACNSAIKNDCLLLDCN
jgi:hypothetical protein